MKSDFHLLAEALWAEIKKLERASVLELIKKRPILHDAAKVGNADIVTMLTRAYPDLIWNTDGGGHTIFHIAVIYLQRDVLKLKPQIGARKDFIAISQDINGNNILHLAAKLAPLSAAKDVPVSALQMQRELAWFKVVKGIVPPSCLKMRNEEGHTPRELFSMEHEKLWRESQTWMRNTADSCMLIATLIVTMVFAATFTVPGGNNQDTGIPIFSKNKLFRTWCGAEAIAFFNSLFSIAMLWSIMTSDLAEDKFFVILPLQMILGLFYLACALCSAVMAFLCAHNLVLFEGSKWYGTFRAFILTVFSYLVVSAGFIRLWFKLIS